MNPITVIHHSADFDGIFCREIARKFLPEAKLIGWDFGDPQVPFEFGTTYYILDLSPDCLCDGHWDNNVIWIDHHKSSIDKWGNHLPGYRIDGVAACRLAWQWFTEARKRRDLGLEMPTKEEFIARQVMEPLAVRLAGEYDIWDRRDERAQVFQFSLRSIENIPWVLFFSDKIVAEGTGMDISEGDLAVSGLLPAGQACQRYQRKLDASLMESRAFTVQWEGLNFLAVNTGRFNSLTFQSAVDPQKHDALLGFSFNGKNWTVSLYHADHNTGIDLSTIAVKHGGGGHRGACGFICQSLPFINL